MNTKMAVLGVYDCACSIFRRWRVGRDTLSEKSNTGRIRRKLTPGPMATAHWQYVKGVLQVHGVSPEDVAVSGEAYLSGFVRGWEMAGFPFDRFLSEPKAPGMTEWRRWKARQLDPRLQGQPCEHHYRTAFEHGWKHRKEASSR